MTAARSDARQGALEDERDCWIEAIRELITSPARQNVCIEAVNRWYRSAKEGKQ